MERHRGLSQAAISPGDWVHLEVSAAAYRQATLRPTVGGEKVLSILLNTCSSLLTRPHCLLTTGLLFFGVGWFRIPSFIIPITNSHFTHPWFFWIHDTLTMTPKDLRPTKGHPNTSPMKRLSVINNFCRWQGSWMWEGEASQREEHPGQIIQCTAATMEAHYSHFPCWIFILYVHCEANKTTENTLIQLYIHSNRIHCVNFRQYPADPNVQYSAILPNYQYLSTVTH